MFDPAVEMEKVKVGITAPIISSKNYFADVKHYIPIDTLTEKALLAKQLDQLLVHGASTAKSQLIDKACTVQNCVVAEIDSLSSGSEVIYNVMLNLKAKLDSNEMPNNLDVVDLRHLVSTTSQLIGFDSHEKLFSYLQSVTGANLLGCIFLAHGDISLEMYTHPT